MDKDFHPYFAVPSDFSRFWLSAGNGEGEVVARVGFIPRYFFFSTIVLPVAAHAVHHIALAQFVVTNWLAIERIGCEGQEKFRHHFLQRFGKPTVVRESVTLDSQCSLRDPKIGDIPGVLVDRFAECR